MQRILNGLAIGKTREEAAIQAGAYPGTVNELVNKVPGFAEQVAAAEEEGERCRQRARGVLDRSLEALAEAHADLGLHAQEERTRAMVQAGILRGRGVLVERPAVELNQDNRSINIIVKSPEGQRVIQDLVAGVRKDVSHNDNNN